MNKIKILFLTVFVSLALQQCSSPTGPPIKPVKDPRTYTWTIDTLKISAHRIWGSSPNDVYIGGWWDADGSLWHYDGSKWSVVKLPEYSYDINGIYGFSAGDVWAVGSLAYLINGIFTDSSFICHYDGSSWKQYNVTDGGNLLAVWGSSSSDVWAGGANTLFHFNGTDMKKVPFFIPPQGVQILSISGLSSKDVYMVGGRNDVIYPPLYYLYHYNGSRWSVVDSSYANASVDARKFGVRLKTIGGSLYSASDKLFKKEGDNWVIINDDPFIFSLGGSSANNLFAGGRSDGTVYHYNGTDWQKIIIKEDFRRSIYDIWTDGTEVFMVSEEFVIHGK